MGWFKRIWYWRLRQVDQRILWPLCRSIAPNIEMAREAFLLHARNDYAWAILSEKEINKIVGQLK